MLKNAFEIVEKLPNSNFIFKIEREILVSRVGEPITKKVVKFALADKNGLVGIKDLNGDFVGISFFDSYSIDEFGNVISVSPFEKAGMRMGIKEIKIDSVVNIGGKYYIKGQNFLKYMFLIIKDRGKTN